MSRQRVVEILRSPRTHLAVLLLVAIGCLVVITEWAGPWLAARGFAQATEQPYRQ